MNTAVSARPPTNTWEGFTRELNERGKEIAPLLPSNVTWERFKNTAIAAAKQDPSILRATPRSLFGALTKAAQDGLLPDGREGFINVYSLKVKRKREGSNATFEDYEDTATWSPMAYGLRKRARELDDMIVDAQAVYANDLFKQVQGDTPSIMHEHPPLGEPRGKLVGAYAIFKKGDVILHREVMDLDQITTVRGKSRNKDGMMWTDFPEEGARKTVVRRGFKTLPVSENLDRIIRRVDEEFDFGDRPTLEGASNAPRSVPTSTTKSLAGPPKAPPAISAGNNGGNGGSGYVGAASTANAAEPIATRSTEGDAPANGGARPGEGGGANGEGGAAPAGRRARPPGVGEDGKVSNFPLFAEYIEGRLRQARDPVELADTFEVVVEPWRERIAPDWFKALQQLYYDILAEHG